MPSRYSSYDDYDYDNSYADSRNGRRPSKTKVLDVPDDRIAWIRERELAAFYGEPETALVLRQDDTKNDSVTNSRQLVRTQRSTDDYDSSPRRNDDSYRRSSRQDRSSSTYDRRGGHRRARTQSEGGQTQQSQQQDRQLRKVQAQGQNQRQSQNQSQNQNPDDESRRVKISMNKDKYEAGEMRRARDRGDGHFFERHFDSSWDGIITAAAGGAIGAITVRRVLPLEMTEEENKQKARKNRMKIIGGAVLGAAAFNATENYFRVWAEEHAEGGEAFQTGMEACCEGLENFPIA